MLHPYLDFNLVEGLAVVHADHGSNHLRQDDHVSQVSLHHLWFLHRRRLLLGLTEALEERLLLPPEATVQPPPLSGTVELHQLLAEEHTHPGLINISTQAASDHWWQSLHSQGRLNKQDCWSSGLNNETRAARLIADESPMILNVILCSLLNAAPSESTWWRFTTNNRTGFTDEMCMTIVCDLSCSPKWNACLKNKNAWAD